MTTSNSWAVATTSKSIISNLGRRSGLAAVARHYYADMSSPTAEQARDAVNEDDDAELVEEDLLVEEISIDGMCGVY